MISAHLPKESQALSLAFFVSRELGTRKIFERLWKWLRAFEDNIMSRVFRSKKARLSRVTCTYAQSNNFHVRMRNFIAFRGLGRTFPQLVEDNSAYPHVESSPGYMGNMGRSFKAFSPTILNREWHNRRNSSVFPSIPNPYYDDYDHV